jgi:hypothetical protein
MNAAGMLVKNNAQIDFKKLTPAHLFSDGEILHCLQQPIRPGRADNVKLFNNRTLQEEFSWPRQSRP